MPPAVWHGKGEHNAMPLILSLSPPGGEGWGAEHAPVIPDAEGERESITWTHINWTQITWTQITWTHENAKVVSRPPLRVVGSDRRE
jgi:hypothetical protein